MASRQQSTGKDHTATPPRVPKGSRVYAIGDIHGHMDLLAALHEKILEDAAKARARRKVLVYLGDYVDRGPGSFDVIDMLIEAPLDGFEIVHLKGNHEDFLLGFLDDPSLIFDWFLNGAGATLESYRVPLLDQPYAWEEPDALRLAFRAALPQSHLDFYQNLKRFHVEGDYLFVHAGVRPGVPLDEQEDKDLLWIRREFLESDADFGHVVVHGHSPATEPDVFPNRIGIDTGAYYTDRVTSPK